MGGGSRVQKLGHETLICFRKTCRNVRRTYPNNEQELDTQPPDVVCSSRYWTSAPSVFQHLWCNPEFGGFITNIDTLGSLLLALDECTSSRIGYIDYQASICRSRGDPLSVQPSFSNGFSHEGENQNTQKRNGTSAEQYPMHGPAAGVYKG